ncbi:hypothetical protein [Paenibacillus sp. MMO-58]|uniref:hypothetical protein n=1 Tax=Paenibacillus sp. MMO-58 TaxID=3081290 RepID=UPI0030188FE1
MTNKVDQKMETGIKMVITLAEHSLPVIEEYSNGVRMASGQYSSESVVQAILLSMGTINNRTPILPRNALFYAEGPGMRFCVIEMPAQTRKAFYHEAEIKAVPFPRLLFGFKLYAEQEQFKITDVMVAALESDTIVSDEAKVYFYPYTNVNNSVDYRVCWGGTTLPRLNHISQLSTIPELFFNTPNSDSYYSSANLSGLTYRELTNSLTGLAFPDSILKPSGLTLKSWIDQITGN